MTPDFKDAYFAGRDPGVLAALQAASAGIAGAGGLGSNVAISLARAGVGRLVVADFDVIEASNLNRQQFFIDQIGRAKVDALQESLQKINPFSIYDMHRVRITRANVADVFGGVDVLIEAFDKAEAKEMLIEAWLGCFPGRPIVAASGLAGYGRNRKLHTRKVGNLYICGDEETQAVPGVSPMAPRVGVVANMQANLVVELLVKMRGHNVQSQ